MDLSFALATTLVCLLITITASGAVPEKRYFDPIGAGLIKRQQQTDGLDNSKRSLDTVGSTIFEKKSLSNLAMIPEAVEHPSQGAADDGFYDSKRSLDTIGSSLFEKRGVAAGVGIGDAMRAVYDADDVMYAGVPQRRSLDTIGSALIGEEKRSVARDEIKGDIAASLYDYYDAYTAPRADKRHFDSIGSGLVRKRMFDRIGSGLVRKRWLDSIGGGLIKRTNQNALTGKARDRSDAIKEEFERQLNLWQDITERYNSRKAQRARP